MNSAVISEPTLSNAQPFSSVDETKVPEKTLLPTVDIGETAFHLGMWLSGLESFLNVQNQLFIVENRAKIAVRDWMKEFRLTHSTLLRCSRLTFQIAHAIGQNKTDRNIFDTSPPEIQKLSKTLKESVLLSEGLLRAEPLRFGEWTAWSNALNAKLKESGSEHKIYKIC